MTGVWLAGTEGMGKKMETTMMGLGFRVITEKNMETSIMGLGFRVRMEKRMETTTMGYIGIAIRIHSFIPS